MKKPIFTIVIISFFMWGSGCSQKSTSQNPAAGVNRSSLQQGISGQVLWYEGDLMPKIVPEGEQKPQEIRGKPVKRKVYIYELTHTGQTTRKDRFFTEISTRLVKRVDSNEEGGFAVPLEAGNYSLFVKEEKGLYANRFDGQGNVNPVRVFKDSVTHVKIRVDYKAVY